LLRRGGRAGRGATMRIRVRSIFGKLVVWFTATVVLSLVGFVVTSMLLSARLARRDPMMPRLHALFLDEARRAYEQGGSAGLTEYLGRLDDFSDTEHFLTDGRGLDLASGEDRSPLLSRRVSRPR